MSRPLRIEFPGAVYHVTSRGDRLEDIFVDDDDRRTLLTVLAHALDRFDAQVLAYCLMSNHYHIVLYTRRGNLSLLMRQLNGVYTQTYNRRHGVVGHLFQGRFKAILVDRDAYLLEVCRYVELNPVRAGMVAAPADWKWSSYLAHVCKVDAPVWLDSAGLHGYLLGRNVSSHRDRQLASAKYASLVAAGRDLPLWDDGLRQQIYLGDEAFVARMQQCAEPARKGAVDIPRAQRHQHKSWSQWLQESPSRNEAMWRAHRESGIRMSEIAKQCGLSVSRVSRLIAGVELAKGKT